MTLLPVQILKHDWKDKECTICLDEFVAEQQIAWLECFCVFHEKCIRNWHKQGRKKICPVHRIEPLLPVSSYPRPPKTKTVAAAPVKTSLSETLGEIDLWQMMDCGIQWKLEVNFQSPNFFFVSACGQGSENEKSTSELVLNIKGHE